VIPIADHNPTRRRPVVTVALIAACILVYLGQLGAGSTGFERTVFAFGVIPAVLTGHAGLAPGLAAVPAVWTLLTYMFLHGSLWHLAGNMLYLWIFGNNVEDRLGHGRFLLFYLAAGVAAALLHVALDPTSEIPMVGASGAISGVLAAYLLWFPRARVLVVVPLGFLFATWVPAALLIGLWVILQIFGALLAGDGGIAWWAHLGGFAAGFVLAPLLGRSPRRRPKGPWE